MGLEIVRTGQKHIPDTGYGVCVWQVDGGFLSDGEGYLSMEGKLFDPLVEDKMRAAAAYWLQSSQGQPVWLPDARKISSMEHDDQMARLLDGKIPDEVDEARQILRGQ
jgi:hypothetical protein